MATYNGKNYILAQGPYRIPPGELNGDLQVGYEEYTSAAALVAADIIQTGIKLPIGRRVYQVIVVSPTGGGTVSVGIAGNATKYANASTAAATVVHSPVGDPISDEENLILTIGGTPSAAGKYKLVVYHCKV